MKRSSAVNRKSDTHMTFFLAKALVQIKQNPDEMRAACVITGSRNRDGNHTELFNKLQTTRVLTVQSRPGGATFMARTHQTVVRHFFDKAIC